MSARTHEGDRGPDDPDGTGSYLQTERHFRVPSVTAPFQSADRAQQAAGALREAGFERVQVDRLQPYPEERGDLSAQPFPQSLTGQGSTDQRFFSARDEAISGNDTDEFATEAPYLLTVVLPQDDPQARDRALRLLREHESEVGLDRTVPRSDRLDAQAPRGKRG